MFKNALPLVLTVMFVAFPASAMNWEACDQFITDSQLAYIEQIGRLYTSVTQVITSTGECAAIGRLEQRREFYVANSEQVKVDCARGQGEYLDALARLTGCSDEETLTFSKLVQKHYQKIFAPSLSANQTSTLKLIDQLVESDATLGKVRQIEKTD